MTHQQIQWIAQADLLLLTADLFRPPEQIRQQLGAVTSDELHALVSAAELAPDGLLHHLSAAIEAARQISREQWARDYRKLFDGAILCPINETTFIRRDKGSIIGDVCGFYRAFGWQPSNDTGERPDHLLVELEFVAILLVMAARAESVDRREITLAALADFTRAHLNEWLGKFCDQLRLSTEQALYVAAAELLSNLWQSLIDYHDWIVDPSSPNTVGIGDEPDEPYECGAADLVPLQTRR